MALLLRVLQQQYSYCNNTKIAAVWALRRFISTSKKDKNITVTPDALPESGTLEKTSEAQTESKKKVIQDDKITRFEFF